jgi:hypothetical protein
MGNCRELRHVFLLGTLTADDLVQAFLDRSWGETEPSLRAVEPGIER